MCPELAKQLAAINLPFEGDTGNQPFGHDIIMARKSFEFAMFRYSYNDPMLENAKLLNSELNDYFKEYTVNEPIILVCHSMGGLIARLATLIRAENNLPPFKRVIMIGTPNFGVFRSSQLSALAQLGIESGRRLWGLFTRKTGIRDLSQVQDIFSQAFPDPKPSTTEYVTIPGTFFHKERNVADMRGGFFSGAAYLLEYAIKAGLQKPHDGIVEVESNRMMPAVAGRYSEKADSINFAKPPPTYVHVELWACDEVVHTTIQDHQKIIKLVAGLIVADDLHVWYEMMLPGYRRNIGLRKVEFGLV
jgi:pimeloyl-ACP methyl ester carboxylesterase